jgi:hypothetical protein
MQNLCAYGRVTVKAVTALDGSVGEATAISGDPILYESAVAAAKKAMFRFGVDGPPIKHTGLVVYNFPMKRKCIDGGVVNKRAITLPAPDLSHIEHLLKSPTTIEVRIIVDMDGEIKNVRAYSGNILYYKICEDAAWKTKFSSARVDGARVDIKGTLVYKFNPDGTIDY